MLSTSIICRSNLPLSFVLSKSTFLHFDKQLCVCSGDHGDCQCQNLNPQSGLPGPVGQPGDAGMIGEFGREGDFGDPGPRGEDGYPVR